MKVVRKRNPFAVWSPFLCALCVFVVHSSSFASEPTRAWSTYRGNSQRTASLDGVAVGNDVLWVWKSPDHFVASPVPWGDKVFIAGLGAFNAPAFYCLSAGEKASQRVAWSKGSPYLKLPTVSSPAIVNDKLIFGDGMHQTDGAVLHCLRLDEAMALWQLPVPGKLVHFEGSVTVADGRVFIGAGAAGVLCATLDRVVLDGKELSLGEVQKSLDLKWKELQAKYESDKEKDPDFAVPPNDDQLPKPAPVQVWQQGAGKWHVDAPVAVTGQRVLVASAYLDKERGGDRALVCLDAKTGDIQWRAPLKYNPWGGPSVIGHLIVVTGSTIGYDPKLLKVAKGGIAAFDLATGKEKWHKDLNAGIVSCAALTKELAVVCCTDGKVRAYQLGNGQLKWSYEANAPLFAPPAIASWDSLEFGHAKSVSEFTKSIKKVDNEIAYVGDLKGVVHAVDLTTGKQLWTVDLANHPAVKCPGMIYGGPALDRGRLFVATCNLEGPWARQPTCVVCIGMKTTR
jgi:outer membrane protein assembly factor BamB